MDLTLTLGVVALLCSAHGANGGGTMHRKDSTSPDVDRTADVDDLLRAFIAGRDAYLQSPGMHDMQAADRVAAAVEGFPGVKMNQAGFLHQPIDNVGGHTAEHATQCDFELLCCAAGHGHALPGATRL